jgi:hypothetical protein
MSFDRFLEHIAEYVVLVAEASSYDLFALVLCSP